MTLQISAKNFRSYSEINWSLPSGLILLDGINIDTNGSNMSGKTTLLDSWFWARYGWLPKWEGPKGGNSDAVIKRGTDSCFVQIVETFTHDTLEIRRERPSKLTVFKNGEQIKGITQKELDQLLGMDAYQFLVSVYLPQKRSKSFYWMTDAERTDLLSLIAGLETLDKCLEVAKKQKEEYSSKIQYLGGSLSVLTEQIQGLPGELEKLKKQRFENQLLLGDAKEAVFKAELDFNTYSNELKSKLECVIEEKEQEFLDKLTVLRFDQATLQGHINGKKQQLENLPQIEPEFKLRFEEAKAKFAEVLRKNDLLKRSFDRNDSLREKLQYFRNKIEQIKNGKCSSCRQVLPEEEKAIKISECEAEIRALEAQIIHHLILEDEKPYDIAVHNAQEAYLNRSAELSVLPNSIKSDISVLEEQLKMTKFQISELERSHELRKKSELAHFQIQLKELQTKVELVKNDCAKKQANYDWAKENYEHALTKQDLLKNRISDLEKEMLENKKFYELSLDLIELFGPKGFRCVCYDGLVDRISERANELLLLMTEHLYSTHLEQTAQDSKGNQKLILRPVLLKNGAEVPKDDLSGGAEARVALAYDIAVSEALSHNLPLLLDETLEGLDAVGKSEAMVLLEEISKNRTVIVIDHASEFKAQFNQVVKVIYENQESRLEAL